VPDATGNPGNRARPIFSPKGCAKIGRREIPARFQGFRESALISSKLGNFPAFLPGPLIVRRISPVGNPDRQNVAISPI
jgi:hypothetical protein